MNLTEYVARKESLIRRLLRSILWVMRSFLTPFGVSEDNWKRMVRGIYPAVKQYRDEVTELSREFFDAQRADQLPGEPRHDFFKDDHYPIEWFEEALHPAYEDFKRTGNYEGAITNVAGRITKVIEDGARRTLINGVNTDTSARLRGWARYDPAPPTCEFCLMMISRGPVYEVDTAGFRGDETLAKNLWLRIERNQGEDAQLAEEYMHSLMKRWHPHCTCIVVPVYKRSGYPSERQEKAAFDIYERARKRADKKDFKSILKEMRRMLRHPEEYEDETELPSVA